MSTTIHTSIELNVPVRSAYNQWTQFEEFPKFMEGVKEVRQLDNEHLHWKVKIAGKEKEWDAEILDQTPDKHIIWMSRGGALNAGMVEFQSLSEARSKILLEITYDPEDIVEAIGDEMGVVSLRVKRDLERFKGFIEARGRETGAWRGTI